MEVGDINVVVRGASGLLDKEHKTQNTIQFLQYAGPMLAALAPEKQLEIMARIARQMDVDMSGILPDPDYVAAVTQDGPSSAPGTPPPALTGASQAAVNRPTAAATPSSPLAG